MKIKHCKGVVAGCVGGADLVLGVQADPLLHEPPDDGGVALPGCPVQGAVPRAVSGTQVRPVPPQHPQHVQPACGEIHVDIV